MPWPIHHPPLLCLWWQKPHDSIRSPAGLRGPTGGGGCVRRPPSSQRVQLRLHHVPCTPRGRTGSDRLTTSFFFFSLPTTLGFSSSARAARPPPSGPTRRTLVCIVLWDPLRGMQTGSEVGPPGDGRMRCRASAAGGQRSARPLSPSATRRATATAETVQASGGVCQSLPRRRGGGIHTYLAHPNKGASRSGPSHGPLLGQPPHRRRVRMAVVDLLWSPPSCRVSHATPSPVTHWSSVGPPTHPLCLSSPPADLGPPCPDIHSRKRKPAQVQRIAYGHL